MSLSTYKKKSKFYAKNREAPARPSLQDNGKRKKKYINQNIKKLSQQLIDYEKNYLK